MTYAEMEAYFAKSIRSCLGFRKPTTSSDYLGWIILRKVTPERMVRKTDLLDPIEDGHLIEKAAIKREYIRQHPYMLKIIELRREVHETDYDTDRDYRMVELYYFATLDEVARFLLSLGYPIEQIQTDRAIDAP